MNDIIGSLNQYVVSFALVTPRILICFIFLPLFSSKAIPRTLRAVIAIGIVFPLAISLGNDPSIKDFGFQDILGLAFKELSIGLILGILFATPFWIYQSVGAFIDNQRGALSAGYMNPAAGPDASMIGELLSKALVIVFIDLMLFVVAVDTIFQTYILWNPTVWEPFTNASDYHILIDNFNDMAIKYVLYSGPVILVLLLIESAFAILGAYSPQLQVYFMAMPAKSLAALLVLIFYINFIDTLTEIEIAYYFNILDVFNGILVK